MLGWQGGGHDAIEVGNYSALREKLAKLEEGNSSLEAPGFLPSV